jgi:hypothetical protein
MQKMVVAMKTVVREKKRLSKKERLFIENQNHCALCSTELQIKVEPTGHEFYLVEEANCPQCKIKTRVKNHGVQ